MSIFTLYRALLGLYPKSFRRQFSEEMLEVFHRKLEERLVAGKAPYLSFVLRECFGLLREAPYAWASIVMPKKKYITFSVPVLSAHFPRGTAEERASSTSKLQELQNEAKDCMLKAAATGDLRLPIAMSALRVTFRDSSAGELIKVNHRKLVPLERISAFMTQTGRPAERY